MRDTLINALKTAGSILLNFYGTVQTIKIKANSSSIVTGADLETETQIIKLIQNAFPTHNIISEETGFINKSAKFTWVVDPLDGTSNFAQQLPWFGTIIAVLENSKPIMGGVYLPLQDELFFAEENQGAWLNGNPIRVTSETDLKNALVCFSTDSQPNKVHTIQEMLMLAQLIPNIRNLRSLNCCIEYCYTAAGRIGGFVNMFTKIWDIAAARLILREAGGVMTDLSGEDFDFDITPKHFSKNYAITGGSKKLHLDIVELIRGIAQRTFKEN
ncbi:inositol monophosphatase [candidate division KSB1 bacterium]|nr:inositol monophosphatase [candidate division KSB1 bacterium]